MKRHNEEPLTSVIRNAIEHGTSVTLSRGLMLRYRPPSQADRRHRLLAYRRGIAPSDREIVIVRRELERVIGRPALPAEPWAYMELQGYVLPWLPDAQQEALPLEVPAMPVHPYRE